MFKLFGSKQSSKKSEFEIEENDEEQGWLPNWFEKDLSFLIVGKSIKIANLSAHFK
jgi:hypothetical protein